MLRSWKIVSQRKCGRLPNIGYGPLRGDLKEPARSLDPAKKEILTTTVQRILDSGVRVILVGLSTPKQERWMFAHRDRLPGAGLVGAGAAFDFHAGLPPQALDARRKSGLEWLLRLSVEPRRLMETLSACYTNFLPLWALQRLGIFRFLHPLFGGARGIFACTGGHVRAGRLLRTL
ncbi:MAG TPA: WecB/TagA/CpsF family glycosyltransferase [Bryobacteraceae bacterium]|nr:WecB/TagA/CpsF family glycosyltransferase [Bryobacteraceae bacterium]